VLSIYNYVVARHKLPASALDAKFIAQAEFRYQIRRFLHFSEAAARRAGLHPQQYQLLLAIRGLPPEHQATIGHLAERLQLQHHSAVELINRAERRGFVKRTGDRADRRQVIVHLTKKGETLLTKLAQEHRNELSIAAPALVRALKGLTTIPRKKDRKRAR
jgi:DNA-binding MarR family transcriptional regulator